MRTSKFNASQRRFALLAVKAGWTVTEVCRVLGITRVTFYRWKKDLAIEVSPETRALLAALRAGPKSPECLQAGLAALAPPPAPVEPSKQEMDHKIARELSNMAGWMWWKGYRRLHRELLRRGFKVGLGRTYRLYQQEGLALRKMHKKANADGTRVGKWPKGLIGCRLVDT